MACAEAGTVDDARRQLFAGVVYCKQVAQEPEPLVCHIIEIKLDTPGLRFTTTPSNGPEAPRETRCETTLAFVTRLGAQLGINGNYFILEEQEEEADLMGLAVSGGEVVSPWDKSWARHAINISAKNEVTFLERPEGVSSGTATHPETTLHNVLTGRPLLLREGEVLPEPGGEQHPRTAIGLTADKKLLLFVADGRQPGYSVGLTFHELALHLKALGARDALALDGGGSSTLVIAGPEPAVVNVPVPAEIPELLQLGPPGIERKNGNNLAVFAPALTSEAGPLDAVATEK